MSVIAASILLLTATPQQQEPPRQPAQTVRVLSQEGTSARFADNRLRNAILEQRLAYLANDRALTVRQRNVLASRLDALISSGRCDSALAVAERSGHADIEGEVVRVCDARLHD